MYKNVVFLTSLFITIVIVAFGLIVPDSFAVATKLTNDFLVDKFGWFYLISMFIFVVFCFGLAFSKYGSIKLGPDDSVPEYKNKDWFAMLFAAGMGIGLIFWGVAEPLNHFVTFGADENAANIAMKKSFMHWSIHAWSSYAVVGMALCYFQFRKNAPGLISSIFLPILGEKGVKGPVGKLIDIFAVFATVAGIATSLGQGTLQLSSGINYLFNIPKSNMLLIIIIIVLAIVYTWSAVSGIDKGIKILSSVNLFLAIALATFAFIIGPKLITMNSFTSAFGMYLGSFVEDSFAINPYGDNSWLASWTIFYWAWFIAWGPFVGTFIARISRGRTIREFVFGVILLPSLVAYAWFAIFGNLALVLDINIIKEAIVSTDTALFVVLAQYPMSFIFSVITIVLIALFFITSANSSIFVLSMFSQDGDLNPHNSKKILWGIIQALLATVLILTGGLEALQSCSIIAAFPLAIIMLMCCYCLIKALKTEIKK